MATNKKLKLKKYSLHPAISFILLIVLTALVSYLGSVLNWQATYTKINLTNLELENVYVTVKNMLNYDGIKYLISNAATNFASFAPLSSLLIGLIGLSIAHASGLLDTFIKRITFKIDNRIITFAIIFLATCSSLINEVGYVILIPLAALLYLANGRSPILGIITAFCGTAFGYGTTIFVGSMEVNLISQTTAAARLIDETFHVSLTSNLYIMIIFTVIISIVGTYVIEKIIAKKIGKYKPSLEETQELLKFDIELEEQKRIQTDFQEQKGLKRAYIAGIIVILLFAYMLIPNLPGSGMLLDMNEKTYLKQLFGSNSYFQDGFTYMVSLFFLITGIAYADGAKSVKNDKELIEKSSEYMKTIGGLILTIFCAAQFIGFFKQTNIGTLLVALAANMIKNLPFTGVSLILLVFITVGLLNLFVPSITTKWTILAPIIVPMMMQSNISPQFVQFIMRAADSITKGMTPLLSFFVIYLGYLNIYNKEKEPITIRQAIQYIKPYCIIIGLTWILLILGWYLIGLPIGPGVYPTV